MKVRPNTRFVGGLPDSVETGLDLTCSVRNTTKDSTRALRISTTQPFNYLMVYHKENEGCKQSKVNPDILKVGKI